ncbi:MAG: exopolysaccharide biosynthesis protein [Proteobacteria bacterium]|nr:exopolysaccharide biosynthesis protein [Pseudomonadota bacterium]
MKKPRTHDLRTSDLLGTVVAKIQRKRTVSLEDIVGLLKERVFGLAILLFCIPNCLPIPNFAGLSALTGIPIGIIGLEMMVGRTDLWLPTFLGEKRIPAKTFAKVLKHSIPTIRKMENALYPRFLVMSSRPIQPLLGLVIVVLATIMSLPIPFGNFMPGWSMAFIALGLIKRDGFVILLGLILGTFTLILLGAVADQLLLFFG